MATSTYSKSTISNGNILAHYSGGPTKDRVARKYKREADKQKSKLFGKIEKKPKFESSDNAMVIQTKDQVSKQKQVTEDAHIKRANEKCSAQNRFQQEFHGDPNKTFQGPTKTTNMQTVYEQTRSNMTSPLGMNTEELFPHNAKW